MNHEMYDVAVIGGGPAGLSAALSARQAGAGRIVILERDREPGGILQQCIHNGFGLHRFKEELTGPGYAGRYIRMVKARDEIELLLDTMVLEITPDRTIYAVSPQKGLIMIQAGAVILTMGCRERTRGAIRIPGVRPAGVFTAGAAQRMVNMEGYLPGKKIVVLGSGDIGLIMARRLTLEGTKVQAVVEIMPYSNGLTRNVVQCLEDYDIPLYLSHTVVKIHGKDRVTGITCAQVDRDKRIVPGSEFYIECDCLLLSVGLIPENELSQKMGVELDPVTGGPIVDQMRQTTLQGCFAAGNVVHVHDLVDFVSEEGDIAGRCAALYAQHLLPEAAGVIPVKAGEGIRTVVPQRVRLGTFEREPVKLFMRVSSPQYKISLEVLQDQQVILSRKLPVAKPGEMLVVDLSEDLPVSSAGLEVRLLK